MSKGTRKCKQCGEVFTKRMPLDMFCSSLCGRLYQKEKRDKKLNNGPVPVKSSRSRLPQRTTVLVNGSPVGEREVFERIWGAEPAERRSFVTGFLLPDIHNAYPWYFSHILPKGKNRYPMFRFYDRNVVLKTFEEHTAWEHHQYRLKDNPQWDHVFRRQEELKIEYDQHKADYEQGKVEYYKT